MTSAYAELHCHSNYSFLEGASHPDELVARARDLEMPALAITDRNGFYGAVKFLGAAQRAGIQPIIGTELTIEGSKALHLFDFGFAKEYVGEDAADDGTPRYVVRRLS